MSSSQADAPAIDAERVIADLRELAGRTSDEDGAQRLCWSETWRTARAFEAELLEEIGLSGERDEAGNVWVRLEGESGGGALAIGSHIDSVPDGGWLDGALGVMSGLGILRAWVVSGQKPPRDLVLVDWADEEGARFGRSLYGSSAAAGTLDIAELEELRDHEERDPQTVLAENGIELAEVGRSNSRLEGLATYLEFHIEQGPVLEAKGLGAAAVSGCVGIERHSFRFKGQASHAGTTPMDVRRDAGLAAATMALAVEEIATAEGGLGTTGVLNLRPGVATAVAGEAELLVDLRHLDARTLARMLTSVRERAAVAAGERECEVEDELVWRIDPTNFDSELVEMARASCKQVTGTDFELPSGALHDAAEMARLMPTTMVFCQSLRGISHAKEEDTNESDLKLGIAVFGELASRVATRSD